MSATQNIRALMRKAIGWLARIVAAVLIILALLVGVARLLLPEAARFKDDIRLGVKQATGFQVDFKLISAGLSVYGPELRFAATTIQLPDGSELATVDNIAISIDLISWATGGGIVPGRIYIQGTAVDLVYTEDGEWYVQGQNLRDLFPADSRRDIYDLPESTLELADVRVSLLNRQRDAPLIDGVINTFTASLDDQRIEVAADLEPGIRYARSLAVEAEIPLEILAADEQVGVEESWRLWVNATDLQLGEWLDIAELPELPVIDSDGDAEVSVNLRGRQVVDMQAKLELESLQLAHADGDAILIDWLDGEFEWLSSAGGWRLTAKDLRLERNNRKWPASEFSLSYATGPEPERLRVESTAAFLRVEDLLPFVQAIMPDQLQKQGITGQLTGDLSDLGLSFSLLDNKLESFAVDASFSGLGYVSPDNGIDLAGYSGRLAADEGGGNLEIATKDARLGAASLFRDVLEVSSLEGLAIWRFGTEGYRILADGITLRTPHASAQASLELSLDKDLGNPVIDMNADASLQDVRNAPLYLPKILKPKILDWLDQALLAGEITEADIHLSGPLAEFPFDHGEGTFLIGVNFTGGKIRYAPDWPLITDANGRLVFDGVSMYSTENSLTLADTGLKNITVRMDDMRTGELALAAAGRAQLKDLHNFLLESPVGAALGPVFADVLVTGSGQGSAELLLPIKNLTQWSLEGSLDVENADIGLAGIDTGLSAVTGTALISNTRITAESLSGLLFDQDVRVSVEPVSSETSAFSHRAFLNGQMTIGSVQQMLGLPSTDMLTGEMLVNAQALFPGGKGGTAPFRLVLRSDLEGVQSNFPFPLNKSAQETEGVQLELEFPREGTTHLYGTLERGISWAIEAINDEGWDLSRGLVVSGVKLPALPVDTGISIRGKVDSLSLDEWTGMFANSTGAIVPDASADAGAAWQGMFREADLQVDELTALGYRFVDVDADVLFRQSDWEIELAGPWTEGRMLVPYDLRGAQPVELEMQRLLLIEPLETNDESDQPLDPRTLPGIQGFVDDFALGSFRLGRMDVDIRRVAQGLKTERLQTRADSFDTELSYDWLVVDNAQRSRLHFELGATDVEDTLLKLGYSPLIKADRGSVNANLLWEGGPGMSSIYASTGTVDLTIRDGTVTDVSPGTGRILGLLSITALPRRLSLDFDDMTEGGLPFDKISGTFRVDFGDAWTCNLGLEGSVADMAAVGRTGIFAQDYEQIAAVRPHVSNLAPVAGAFIAGPAVGVVALLVTQILKKPLSSIGESYYSVSGSWDDPQFVKSDRADLDTAAFSDCEAQLPPLSPEEIQAIEGLLASPQPGESPEVVAQPAGGTERLSPEPGAQPAPAVAEPSPADSASANPTPR